MLDWKVSSEHIILHRHRTPEQKNKLTIVAPKVFFSLRALVFLILQMSSVDRILWIVPYFSVPWEHGSGQTEGYRGRQAGDPEVEVQPTTQKIGGYEGGKATKG